MTIRIVRDPHKPTIVWWIDVKDQLPPNGTRCIAWCIEDIETEEEGGDVWFGIEDVIFYSRTGWVLSRTWERNKRICVTHWSEFPKNPTELKRELSI